MEDHESTHWSLGLPSVIFRINTRTTHTTRKTPYQLVFGQNPRTNTHYWECLYDEAKDKDIQLNDLIIDKIIYNDANVTIEKCPEVLPANGSITVLGDT